MGGWFDIFWGEGLHWLFRGCERHIGNWVMHGSSGYRVVAGKMIIFRGSSSLARCRHPELSFGGHTLGGCKLGVLVVFLRSVFCVVELLAVSLQEYHKDWCEAGSWVGGEF